MFCMVYAHEMPRHSDLFMLKWTVWTFFHYRCQVGLVICFKEFVGRIFIRCIVNSFGRVLDYCSRGIASDTISWMTFWLDLPAGMWMDETEAGICYSFRFFLNLEQDSNPWNSLQVTCSIKWLGQLMQRILNWFCQLSWTVSIHIDHPMHRYVYICIFLLENDKSSLQFKCKWKFCNKTYTKEFYLKPQENWTGHSTLDKLLLFHR